MSRLRSFAKLAPVCTLLACNGAHAATSVRDAGSSAPMRARAEAAHTAASKLSLAAQVGQKLFFDEALSLSGNMSCATCHDPERAYGPPNNLAVQLGGARRTDPGIRAVPSLRYKEFTPAFADLLDNPDGISAPGPGGGFAWDGRANTLAEQAKAPLFSPFEMANRSPHDVVDKVRASAYASLFEEAFGHEVWNDADKALDAVAAALQAFQLEDVSFHPYTSKFDLYSGNKIGGTLTAAEIRGLQVFSNPKKGNCSSCHFQGAGLGGSVALFTDFSYEAIGVPKNPAITINGDRNQTDLGICGPLRVDHASDAKKPNKFCGMFKTPTLRNVTTRGVFFHNGVMHSIEQVMAFYNTRDTNPELWYPTVGGTPKPESASTFPKYGLVTTQYVGGTVQKFDDLPKTFRGNIDSQMPLDGRAAGKKPPMTEHEVADLTCFLGTLVDDYEPPLTPPTFGPCLD